MKFISPAKFTLKIISAFHHYFCSFLRFNKLSSKSVFAANFTKMTQAAGVIVFESP